MIAFGCRVLIRKSLVKPAPEVQFSRVQVHKPEAEVLSGQVQLALVETRLSGLVQLMSGPGAKARADSISLGQLPQSRWGAAKRQPGPLGLSSRCQPQTIAGRAGSRSCTKLPQ